MELKDSFDLPMFEYFGKPLCDAIDVGKKDIDVGEGLRVRGGSFMCGIAEISVYMRIRVAISLVGILEEGFYHFSRLRWPLSGM